VNNSISTHDLSKTFRHTEAVNALNLDVAEGNIHALIGPNGAGKTTTIKLLMNILRASAGSAEVLGVDSRRLSPREFARIGYVSENQEMPEWMTVEYFLAYLKPFYPGWDDALAEDLLRQFELPRDRKLRHLSRGMRMKAALASSLAYHPELVLLDEPFTGLDALVRDEFVKSLLERAEGTTIFIASHDLAEIENFASHISYIEEGRLRFAEEIGALAGRFRLAEITFEAAPPMPAGWPAAWMRPETSAAVLRFIDSRFDAERTPAEIQRLFPGARNVEFYAMSLREIFVALAIAGRQAKAA
jgi:ABC-2 type transport system ATP-binding protein